MPSRSPPRVVVLGGAVMDLVFPVRDLPRWGQSVQAHSFDMYPGGKGLNQAVAAARLGAKVSLITAIGSDEFGVRILKYLEAHRISLDFVEVARNDGTDVTCVMVGDTGHAAFVGWKGTTVKQVGKAEVRRAQARIEAADAVLITFEVSLAAVQEAVAIASKKGALVVLDPAPPLDPLDPPPYSLLPNVDLIVPTRWEATQLLRVEDGEPTALARLLRDAGARGACVTVPEYGCALATRDSTAQYPSLLIGKPVDTTGGTDAFCAASAVALTKGFDLERAVTMGNAAAAIAVMRRGGSPSMPTTEELNLLLRQRRVSIQLDTNSGLRG